jgi:hypothetical protein
MNQLVLPRRPHQLGRRNDTRGDLDQLLRAADRRFGGRDRRRQARHLQRARRGRRNDAPWRRCRLRLLVDPPDRCHRQGDAVARFRPGVVHARLRPLVRDRRIGRRAPWRADGRAALRPPGHRGLHPRQGPRRPDQLQRLDRRHRRLHASRRSRRGSGTDAPRRTQRRHEAQHCLPA